MKKEVLRTLKRIGLSENEIKVYTEAIKLEETSPYKLSKLTGIPRTTVYDVIADLSLKGLLELERSDGYTKQQTKIRAKNPSVLRNQLRSRHTDLHKLEVDLVNILPNLKGDYHTQKPSNSNFQYHEGIEGAKRVHRLEKELIGKVPIDVITSLLPMDALGKEFVNRDVATATKKAMKSSIEIRELIPLNDWTKHILTYQYEREPDYLVARVYRYIDNPIFRLNQRLVIAGDQVLIICTSEDEAYGLAIRSGAYSDSMRSIFSLLWVSASQVTLEMVRSWGENQFAKYESRGGTVRDTPGGQGIIRVTQ